MPISITDSDFLRKARERFTLANDADTAQAEREQEDIAFEDGDQWPTDVKLARQGQQPTNGMPAVPARPTLVINKVKEPVRQILNQERQSDIGVEIVPADDFGDLGVTPDDTEITLREGLVRRIQRESHAADARTWAFKRAVIAGRGYYFVNTRFLPGKSWDQEVHIERIYNQSSVVGDPSRTQPDGSDSEYWFWGTWMLGETFVSEFPYTADGDKNPFVNANEQDFMAAAESYPNWYKQTGSDDAKTWSVRVVNYLYVERVSKRLHIMEDGTLYWDDELPNGATPLESRTVVQKTIQFSKIGGGIVELERTTVPGSNMPMVEVLGDEVLPYDEQKRANGIVRPARDANMGFNYMVSKQVETVGLTPISPLMVDPEAIDGYEAWYAVANTRALPYLPSRTYDDNGRQLKEPHRPVADANLLPIAQSVALFDAAVKSTTAVPDPTLGNVDPALKSGKAIERVVANAQLSTSNFLDNLARSIRYEGQIVNGMLFDVYGRKPGRMVRILTGTGDGQRMMIGNPQDQALTQRAMKVGQLTEDAHFNVIVKIAKSFDSRRSQEANTLGELIAANPGLLSWFGDLFFKNSDTPGHLALSERAKVMLAPPIQALLASQEQGRPFDPQAQAEVAQLKTALQQAQQAMQQLGEEANKNRMEYQRAIDTEKIKQSAEAERARLEADKELRLQAMKDAAQIEVARINAETKGITSVATLQEEAIALDRTQAHEAAMADLDRQHERDMTAQNMAHAAAMADGQQQADASMQAQSMAGRSDGAGE